MNNKALDIIKKHQETLKDLEETFAKAREDFETKTGTYQRAKMARDLSKAEYEKAKSELSMAQEHIKDLEIFYNQMAGN